MTVARTNDPSTRRAHTARRPPSQWALELVVSLAAMFLPAFVFAAQTDITISTAAAPATPHINGPKILGWFPKSFFLYSVAATGQPPLKFAASGLPAGLSIDAALGTISGTAPAEGTYPIALTVSNGLGSATSTLALKVGSTLALTPPMGWNSYDSFGANVNESDVKAATDAMTSVLRPYQPVVEVIPEG